MLGNFARNWGIIKPMRRFLVIFMLFLLPLRGLVGDAMAYSMLPGGLVPAQTAPQVATNTGAAYAHSLGIASTFDAKIAAQNDSNPPCHMGAAAADGTDASASQCTTCQACHLSAAIPLQLPSSMLHIPAALPAQHAALWASAEPRLLAKTPVL